MAVKKTKKEIYEKLMKDLAVDEEELELLSDGTFPSWGTGCTVADLLTGIGGLPKGRIVEIYGPYSSGKSNLAISMGGVIQKQGKKVVFLDYERTFDPVWAKKLGLDALDTSTFSLIRADASRTVEDGLDVIHSLLSSDMAKDIGLIIWDSLGGSVSVTEADKDSAADYAKVASRASVLNIELPKLGHRLKSENLETTIVFVNQVRTNMDPMSRKKEDTPGGKAFNHAASMRIGMKEVKKITKTTVDEFTLSKQIEQVGQRIKIIIEKTKHGQRGRSGEAIFTFQNGFDNVGILVEYACARGDFNKISAQKFEVPAEFTLDNKPFEGTEAVIRRYYYANPEAEKILIEEMSDRINKSYWEKVKSFSFRDQDFDMVPEAIEEDRGTGKTLDLEVG